MDIVISNDDLTVTRGSLRCRDCETRYLVRTLVQNLRVGANWRSVIGSLARATLLEAEAADGGRSPTKARLDAAAAAAVEAFHVCPSLDILVPALLEPGGATNLESRISLTPGQIPIIDEIACMPSSSCDCNGNLFCRGMRLAVDGRCAAQAHAGVHH